MNGLHYILLVNLYLLLFYGFYRLLLRNETFFKWNRVYLVSGALLSFLIPLIQSEWIKSFFITQQVEQAAQTVTYVMLPLVIVPVKQEAFTTGEMLFFIYLTGAAFCFLRFIWQLNRVNAVLKKSASNQAFSFFNRVSVDPALPNGETITHHELVHTRQWHSADVIFFELVAIINWFNPVVYLYKKAIKHIHEFIADEAAAGNEKNKSAYAMLLLSATFGVQPHQFTNSFFNQSLLKRRIIMLHKSKSAKTALLKYGLSAPLFAIMLIFSSAFVSEKSEQTVDAINPTEIGLNVLPSMPQSLAENVSGSSNSTSDTVPEKKPEIVVINTNGKPDPIYILDGKEISSVEMKKIDPDKIQSVNVIKEKDGVEIAGYGERSKNGVVIISSKNGKADTSILSASKLNMKKSASGKDPMFIVDGVVMKDGFKPNSLEDIASVDMLKGERAVIYYGESVGNGVVVINTKNPAALDEVVVTGYKNSTDKVTFSGKKATGTKDGTVTWYGNPEISGTWPNALYIINGKKYTSSEGSDILKYISPNDIESIDVLKGASAIKIYGEGGKNGVIKVTLKKKVEGR